MRFREASESWHAGELTQIEQGAHPGLPDAAGNEDHAGATILEGSPALFLPAER